MTSGIPTAEDLVWEFKREIFCSETRTHAQRVGSLADPTVRAQLQTYFDSRSGHPHNGDDTEYGVYFSRVFADAEDRRRFIAKRVEEVRPSHGLVALALLMREGRVRLVWTTTSSRRLLRDLPLSVARRAARRSRCAPLAFA